MKNLKVLEWIFVLLAIIMVGIFTWQKYINNQDTRNNNQTNSNIQNQNSEIENWKTYKNDEYGFEFKYPKEWVITEERGEDYFLVIIGHDANGIFGFSVREKTEEEYLNSFKSAGFYIVNKSNTIVGNRNAIFYTFKRTDTPLEIKWRIIVIAKDNAVVEFSMGATEDYDNIFYQTLTTFKFTK